MLDPSAQTSSTGVYPFYLDYGSSTMVYIKNTSREEQRYITHLVYEDSRYRIGVKNIAAGETVAIDIRSLRDDQVPDEEGEVIPANVMRGQLRWTRIGEGEADSPAMIGRAEQVYEGRAMSSTYACQSCCGDTPVGRFISPSLSGIQVGQTVQMRAFEIRSDCNGWEYQVERGADWESTNEDVATVDDNEITFVGAGQTTIKASWNSTLPFSTQCAGNPGFLPGPEPIGPTVCCTNRPVPQSVSTGAIVQRPEIKISTVSFAPASVTIGGAMDTSTASVDISADPPCSFSQCLQPGDFVVVQIRKDTSGGTFQFAEGQTKLIPLDLGDSVKVSFKIQVLTGTSAAPRPMGTDYIFTIRVSDVRRPNNPQSPPDLNNSTSILPPNGQVVLQPTSGGNMGQLKVFPMN